MDKWHLVKDNITRALFFAGGVAVATAACTSYFIRRNNKLRKSRAHLCSLKLSELQARAAFAGASKYEIENVIDDEEEESKVALAVLIVAKEQQQQQKADAICKEFETLYNKHDVRQASAIHAVIVRAQRCCVVSDSLRGHIEKAKLLWKELVSCGCCEVLFSAISQAREIDLDAEPFIQQWRDLVLKSSDAEIIFDVLEQRQPEELGLSMEPFERRWRALSHGRAGFIDNPGQITDFYEIHRNKLGEGSYGSVRACAKKSTGVLRAVKSIAKSQMMEFDGFKQEIAIMKLMDHPNIIKLHESFEDHRNIYLIMELCTGGELLDRIIEAGHFSEAQAACVMQHMFRAIFYMHGICVCHRDLKPQNFLYASKDAIETCALKLIDFGLACNFSAGQTLRTKAGTPYYMAPQVLAGSYDQSCDLWSLGVIMYVVLSGYPPFYADTDADIVAKVRLGNFSFNASDWENISEDAKNLIRMLLKMNPKDRYTAEQALNHIWVRNKAPKSKNVALQQSLVDNLRGFRSQNKLKKVALHVIAHQLGESQIKNLRETFMALDGNGDGLLTVNEMKEGLDRCGLKEIPADLQQIMEDVDSDGSGVIDYTEFLAATLDKKVYMCEDICWQAFCIFDRNGDGKIDRSEIRLVLNDDDVQDQAATDLAAIMLEIDKNGDGEIDFHEFMEMMRRGSAIDHDAT